MKQTPFFYMNEDPADYDEYAPLTDRAYSVVHALAAELIASWMRHANCDKDCLVVDIGCGTGAELIHLLRVLPSARILCVDASHLMLAHLSTKVARAAPDDLQRCTLVQADFSEPGWLERALRNVPASASQRKCVVAVSVYALHHLDVSRKRSVYAEIARHVRPLAPFLNVDLFSYSDPWLAAKAQQEEEDWIRIQFEQLLKNEPLDSDHRIRVENLVNHWLGHVRTENKPLPIYSSLSDPVSEAALLREAGFLPPEVIYRNSQTAAVWALRSVR